LVHLRIAADAIEILDTQILALPAVRLAVVLRQYRQKMLLPEWVEVGGLVPWESLC